MSCCSVLLAVVLCATHAFYIYIYFFDKVYFKLFILYSDYFYDDNFPASRLSILLNVQFQSSSMIIIHHRMHLCLVDSCCLSRLYLQEFVMSFILTTADPNQS